MPDVSIDMIRHVLNKLKKEGGIISLMEARCTLEKNNICHSRSGPG